MAPPKQRRLKALPEYLADLGLERFKPLALPVQCEACQSLDIEIIGDHVCGRGADIAFQVGKCSCCSLLMQLPRFEPAFYAAFYATCYREQTWGENSPSEEYLADQIERGVLLLSALSEMLPPVGTVLDVGCASGGMLVPFKGAGWRTLGFDPDPLAIETGRTRFDVDIRVSRAEDIELNPDSISLILIMGSLEHVYDPQHVLRLCRQAIMPGGALVVEGHGLGQAQLVGAFGQNHRRYLTEQALEAVLPATGWQLEWISHDTLCGPTRPGSIFAFARPLMP